MARKKKQSNHQENDPNSLQEERPENPPLQSVLRDERTHKILGTVFLVYSIFLFCAFASYLFTWKADQDQVLQGAGKFLFSLELKVHNLMGRLGAWTAHHFFYNAFGVASFLLCSTFLVLGINKLFVGSTLSLARNIRYVLVGLILFPIFFSFFLHDQPFPWGGAFGNYCAAYLNAFAGKIGTGILLILSAISYFIWRFNPTFKWPEKKVPPPPQDLPEEEAADDLSETLPDEEIQASEEEPERSTGGNSLLAGSGAIVLAGNELQEQIPEVPFTITEKEMQEEEEEEEDDEEDASVIQSFTPVTPSVQPTVSGGVAADVAADLELEIKSVPDTLPEENTVINQTPATGKIGTLYDPFLDLKDYRFPSLDLLENHGSEKIVQDPAELENYKNQIINTLRNYDIEIQKISATVGPTVTLYEIVPAAGVRISRIKNLEDDIALSLAALGIRIIAPIPGKGTIGIEVPNVKKTVVSMKTLLASDKFQNSTHSLPIAIGKKIDNENFIVDLASMPHLLMAGATGQGKSVGLNAILVSLLYKKHPSQLKLVLVDPKKVELSLYRHIEHHFLAKLPGEEEAIITDTKKVISTLNALCIEMDNRYDLLKEAGCRNLKEYNEKFVARKLNPQNGHQYLPFIVLVIDEFADLIMTAGKEVETPIARLAQLARAVGIHLIIATQRPSVNIITGTIKANFPARIAFKVSSKIDSRTILDTGGAEQLIGKGDMLISYNGELTRLQCAFVDTPEVDDVVSSISDQRGYPQAFLLPEYVDEKEMDAKEFDVNSRDPLFADAARLIVQNQVGSTSLIQRRMKLGYNRAGRLMDQLEAAGVVGKSAGSKARDVLIKSEADLDQLLAGFE
ncbi:MAG: DNA translocase FtsK [Bacteroidetes bacterium]|nr:DNA translocase FtsK [Bacteroidota bacterium]